MKTTLSWLKTHLETQASLDEIVALLVMRGFEVESIENRAKDLAPFRVARVIKAEPHPNADKLKLCVVDAGAGEVQVVCGAPNAHAGMLGVFAPPGALIPRSGEVLKASAIRGVLSNGMLCSGWELGLSEDREGIIELPPELEIGQPFATATGLDDPVLDVKVTANRGDCLGVRGIARDLAAAGVGKLASLGVRWYEGKDGGEPATAPVAGIFPCPIGVHLAGPDDKACPLFLGRMMRGVRNGPSPRWLAARLEAIGLRPISALVDITNFITFDLGRPLHVFDADKLAGDLAVRGARPGETLAALNGRGYVLDPEMTVIADDSGPLSLGGVIGGESTGCTEATVNVYIEAALFDPVRTAATGRKLNLQSDARYRFERGVDPEFVRPGLEAATRLVLALCGGEPSAVAQSGEEPLGHPLIRFRPDRAKSLGGLDITAAEQISILENLGCIVTDGAEMSIAPPSWRHDIEGEADLVEEILRIHGYEHVPAVPLPREFVLPRPALDPAQRRAGFVRRSLAARGLTEAVTYSFLPSGHAALFGGGSDALRLANPISADLDAMRPSLLPNLLAAAKRNADRGFADCALFEVGAQYRDDTPEGQALMASGVRTGRTGAKRWDDPGRPVDAFLAKADAVAALAAAGVAADSLQFGADPPAWYHPGRGGSLRLGPKVLAWFGELHPAVAAAFDVKGAAAGFELFLDAVPLPRARGRARPLLKLSPFQPVERDFAFIVPGELAAETLLRTARGVDKKLVAEVRLFDVYTGPGVPEGKKSLAITVVLQPEDATLTDAMLEGFSKKLVAAVEKATGGSLRG
ncbi:MAG TPA: phenylalanine--tRNA ligase subunit beta [Stellaceae bacterium]|nr:phenylalanine--tRNA ligase subunit beta [Stellaceae bacterium]